MDPREPAQVRGDHRAPRVVLLERTASPRQVGLAGGNQEHTHAVFVCDGNFRTAAGVEAPRARRLPVHFSAGILSADLLYLLPGASLPAPTRSIANHPGSVFGLRSSPSHRVSYSLPRSPGARAGRSSAAVSHAVDHYSGL